MLQFSENDEERDFLEQLISHEHEFRMKERPCQGGTFQITGNSDYYTADLIWKKSGVLFFLSENEEEYRLAKETEWKCICATEKNDDWNDLLNILMER